MWTISIPCHSTMLLFVIADVIERPFGSLSPDVLGRRRGCSWQRRSVRPIVIGWTIERSTPSSSAHRRRPGSKSWPLSGSARQDIAGGMQRTNTCVEGAPQGLVTAARDTGSPPTRLRQLRTLIVRRNVTEMMECTDRRPPSCCEAFELRIPRFFFFFFNPPADG